MIFSCWYRYSCDHCKTISLESICNWDHKKIHEDMREGWVIQLLKACLIILCCGWSYNSLIFPTKPHVFWSLGVQIDLQFTCIQRIKILEYILQKATSTFQQHYLHSFVVKNSKAKISKEMYKVNYGQFYKTEIRPGVVHSWNRFIWGSVYAG